MRPLLWLGLLLSLLLCGAPPSLAVYDLPNNDAGCPANCRQIPWLAGADTWNGTGTPGSGTLPTYTAVPCLTGLSEGDSTTDNTTAIQACLNGLSPQQAAVLPPGIYYVDGMITPPSNTVLRGAGAFNCTQGTMLSATFHGDTGAGAACTTLKFGANGVMMLPGGGSRDTPVTLASGYTKGSTSIVTSGAHSIAVNDWIAVAEVQGNTDPPVNWNGGTGACSWCGVEDDDGYLMSQVVKVTSVAGNTLGLARPLYYTFSATRTPRIRELVNLGHRAGVEHLKLWGSTNARTWPHIRVSGCMECWVKGVETYNTPNVAKAYPVYMQYSGANEIRDSYFHSGQGNGSDRNYGIGLFGPNSDHKVENNIYRENRHGFAQEGGGSGNVFLYNYIDDQYTDDLTYLAYATPSHGAHPYMNLFEGNIVQHFMADHDWGSSSHNVVFRNWLRGDTSGVYPGYTASVPDWGFAALELAHEQTYYGVLGNILGAQSLHTSWAGGTVFTAACDWESSRTQPRVYGLGCTTNQAGPYNANVRTSTILHGNYDYTTAGVAFWDGGADHALKNSMYYPTKPAWFGAGAWPVFGPDLTPMVGTLPAQTRFATVAPLVAMTAPTSGPSYTTGSTPLTTLAGTGLDDLGITSLTWVNDRGGSGTATCGTCGLAATAVSWTVPSIALQSGDNVLTVTAHGRRQVVGSAVMTVTLQTGPPGAGPPTQMINANMVVAGHVNSCQDTGTANTLTCALDRPITAYMPRACYSVRAAATNTGATTANFGPGAVPVKKFQAGSLVDLTSGDISSGQIVQVCYDGTVMQRQ